MLISVLVMSAVPIEDYLQPCELKAPQDGTTASSIGGLMKFTNLMIATLVLGAAGSVFAKAEVNPPATERVVSINSV